MWDEVLERLGLSYEELSEDERNVLEQWMDVLNRGDLTLGMVKEYIARMKDMIIDKVADTKHNSKQDLLLKARLKNYTLLEAFMTAPEVAKKKIDQQITAIAGRVKKPK